MGIIQIIPHATTVAQIQKEGGGIIRGTFRDEVLKKWLERKNPTPSKMEDAEKTFMLSCAGYCVATYVLGLLNKSTKSCKPLLYEVYFLIKAVHSNGILRSLA